MVDPNWREWEASPEYRESWRRWRRAYAPIVGSTLLLITLRLILKHDEPYWLRVIHGIVMFGGVVATFVLMPWVRRPRKEWQARQHAE